MSLLRQVVTCIVTGIKAAFSTASLTGFLGGRRHAITPRAVLGCVGCYYRTCLFCRIGQRSLRNGRVLTSGRGCCVTSRNVHRTIFNNGVQSVGLVLRGVICLRLLHQNCRIAINEANSGRVSFMYSGHNRGLCIRIYCLLTSSRAIGHRFNTCSSVHSGFPGCIISLSRFSVDQGKVGRQGVHSFLLTRR